MSVPFEEQRSVWTHTDDPEWLRKNGVTDMVIAGNLSAQGARFLCERLLLLRPDLKFEVRNNHNEVSSTFEYRAPLKSSAPTPTRRTLGQRGV